MDALCRLVCAWSKADLIFEWQFILFKNKQAGKNILHFKSDLHLVQFCIYIDIIYIRKIAKHRPLEYTLRDISLMTHQWVNKALF